MIRILPLPLLFLALTMAACNSDITGDPGDGSDTTGTGGGGTGGTTNPAFYYSDSDVDYKVAVTISSNTVISTGGTISSFSISPDLKAQTGLTFSTSTGTISGKPTTVRATTTYTVTGNGSGGKKGTATVKIEITADNATLLKAHTWKMTKATVSPGVKIGSTTYTNLFNLLDDCGKDNTYKFSSNGSLTDKTATYNCSTKSSSATWSLNSSQTILKITSGGQTDDYDIETLTATTLKISTNDINYGDGKSHETTYTFED